MFDSYKIIVRTPGYPGTENMFTLIINLFDSLGKRTAQVRAPEFQVVISEELYDAQHLSIGDVYKLGPEADWVDVFLSQIHREKE